MKTHTLNEIKVIVSRLARQYGAERIYLFGCGFVGSSSAFALMQSGLFSEMVLIDVDKNRAEGEALDIAHGMTFAEPMKIYAGDYSDVADAAMLLRGLSTLPQG